MEVCAARFPEDLPLVRCLFAEYATGLGVDLCFQGFDAELAGLPGAYTPPGGGLWLAREGDELAGCVAMRPLDTSRAEMKRLYVRPAFRGKGVGRLLAEQIIDAATVAGYRHVCLDTLPTMADAIRLYRSLGFVPIEPYCHNPVCGAMFFDRQIGDHG
jgi:ribosomal protein S18 acetylase RimI-like enzyme